MLILAGERRLAMAMSASMADAGLSRSSCDILLSVRADPGLGVAEHRARLGMTVPTFARLLGQLDRRGLIEKRPGRQDARRRQLRLSAAGKTVAEPVAAALRDALRPAYRQAGADEVAGALALLASLLGDRDG